MKRVLLALAAVVVAVGLWAFEPWRAFTSSTVDEAPPTVKGVVATGNPTSTATPPTPTEPTVLATGRFVDAEHDTSGRARILELADGSRYLRLEGLATSDGPDLHVWLSDDKAGGSWFTYDDGEYLRLGELKATHGNQNYRIPDDANLSAYQSAVIWCDRFNVAFGAAALDLSAA